MSNVKPKEQPTEMAQVLAELRKLRARVEDIADNKDWSDECDDQPCMTCEKTNKASHHKQVSQLAQTMCRDETSGDISWLPYEEQERWRRRAAVAMGWTYKPEDE